MDSLDHIRFVHFLSYLEIFLLLISIALHLYAYFQE